MEAQEGERWFTGRDRCEKVRNDEGTVASRQMSNVCYVKRTSISDIRVP